MTTYNSATDLALQVDRVFLEHPLIRPYFYEDLPVPDYVVPAGRAVPVPYNGSVARLVFGPLSAARVRRWLAAGGFDLVHVHEPATPSLSPATTW